MIVDAGYAVYVDWIEDEELNRSKVTAKTAQTLKRRMNCSRGLAYIATTNTLIPNGVHGNGGILMEKITKGAAYYLLWNQENIMGKNILGYIHI